MIPTVAQVTIRMQSLLGDEEKRVFSDALCLRGYQQAYEYLSDAMVRNQIPRAIRVATYTLPANTTELTPATASLTNFGELIELSERASGTSEDFIPLYEGDLSGNGRAAGSLGIFEWRGDSFIFYGATSSRQLRFRYYDSGEAPTSGSVGIDGSLNFLATYGAAQVGPSRGYDDSEIQRMRREALGPNLDGNGGLLFDLIQPMVRGLQRVQQQPQPYGAGAYSWRRSRPPLYIAAPPTTEGLIIELDITGTQDGENTVFALSQLPQSLQIYNNGILQYPDVAYTRDGTIITFLPGYVPVSTDLLRAEGIV